MINCAITWVIPTIGGAILGSLAARQMISAAGALSMKGCVPWDINIGVDMNCSKTFNLSDLNSSHIAICFDNKMYGLESIWWCNWRN